MKENKLNTLVHFMLPSTFPQSMVPQEVVEFIKACPAGTTEFELLLNAKDRGLMPILRKLPRYGNDVYGLALCFKGLNVPLMVRLKSDNEKEELMENHEPVTFSVSPADLKTITDVEIAFGSTRFLPPWDAIPQSFFEGNIYTHVAEWIFLNSPCSLKPAVEMRMKDGFDVKDMKRAVQAHLGSFAPKHEHKIAGVGYLMSLVADFTEE